MQLSSPSAASVTEMQPGQHEHITLTHAHFPEESTLHRAAVQALFL